MVTPPTVSLVDDDTYDVVDRALQRMRLLAAVVLVFQSLIIRPESGAVPPPILVQLAAAAVVLTVLGALSRAARQHRGTGFGRVLLAMTHTADILVAVVAVRLSSHVEAAWVLLVVPVLAGALRFRLRGAFSTWLVVASLHLGWFVGTADTDSMAFLAELGPQVTIVAAVLLVALPAGYLSEHLLIEMRGLARVYAAAERRSELLGVVAEASRRVTDLDSQVFVAALEASSGIGFTASELWEHDGQTWLRLTSSPPDVLLPPLADHLGSADCTAAALVIDRQSGTPQEVAGLTAARLEAAVLTSVPGRNRITVLRAVLLQGEPLNPSQVECLVLLAQQAGVALRNGELVADLRQARQELEHRAFHDDLTGIANRALFTRQLEQTAAAARRSGAHVGVLFCDLDRFKIVNDSLGHAAGNELLRTAVQRLQGCLREDALLARMGGDEFTILLPDLASPHEAEAVADRVCKALRLPFTIEGVEVSISTSVGIAYGDASCLQPGELLRRGDVAMYRSKARGRDCWTTWHAELEEFSLHRLRLENDLRQAVTADDITVVLQPLVRTDGTVVGAEALARWTHPVAGAIGPAEFIAIAEDSDLIVDLGRAVARRTIAVARQWLQDADPECFVALNISPRQLISPGFADELDALRDEAGLPAGRLLLEITERIVGTGPEAVAALNDLASRGYRLALDDFGQGQTSLQHIRRFPLTALKIDQGFVADGVADMRVRAILKSIITLGRDLDLDVIAEGVESKEQADVLLALGCTYLQGYAIALPVAAAELPAASGARDPAAVRRRH